MEREGKGTNRRDIALNSGKQSKKKKDEIKIGTWNIRGTYERGKLKYLAIELKKANFDIVALQETKQLGNEVMEVGDYIFMNSGGENRILGTGFMIKKELKSVIVDFIPITDRLCKLRLKGKYQKITLINVHAPSEDKKVDIKEKFYSELSLAYDMIQKYDMKIVLGDANAQIGREEMFRPTIGKYSKHVNTNENGHFLIDFAKERDLIVKSTYFQRKEIYKGTWRSPDGKTVNQIDHVLIEKSDEVSIKNVRTYRGPDGDSDHFMVGVTLIPMIPIEKNKRRENWRASRAIRLTTEDEQMKYRDKINSELDKMEQTGDIEEDWEKIKTVMKMAAKEADVNVRRSQKPWFDEECLVELERRNKLRLMVLTKKTEEVNRAYREQRKNTKRKIRRKKREYNENKLRQIEESYKNNEVRNLYQGIRKEKKGYQPRTIIYKDKDNKTVVGEDEILGLWRDYFDELLNGIEDEMNIEEETEIHRRDQEEEEQRPPTVEEIQEIIRKLKNDKSPGSDQITAEMFKYGGIKLEQQIQKLIKEIWLKEQLPNDWTEAILCPIYKKGGRGKCENYRGIALLNVVYKILAIHVKNRITTKMEDETGEYQCGFRQGRGVIDQIYLLREIQSESYEYMMPTFLVFIDFKQAYDKVKRKDLYKALEKLEISGKDIQMIKLMLKKTDNRVRVNSRNSDIFEVREGVRQGDPMSSVLFSLCLENVIRDANINRSGLIYQKKHQCLAFADDIVILTRSKQELKSVFKRLEERAKKVGLIINETKTKFMSWTDEEFKKDQYFKITTDGGKIYKLEEVAEYTYLGTIFGRRPGSQGEIHNRILAGNRCIYALNNILKSKVVSRKAKVRMYKTVIRPIIIYGSEVWTLTKAEEKRLAIWERKVLRRIYGGRKEGEIWVRRTNQELQDLYSEPNIVGVIKGQRMRWLGHVQRMPEYRMPKQILRSSLSGRRRRGRPKTRWRKEVEGDLERMGIGRWRERAENKKEWKKLITEAMGRIGLEC